MELILWQHADAGAPALTGARGMGVRGARAWPRPAAVVIGADEVGSAIAVALDRAGLAAVLCDEVDPAWPRRGMAFVDAWYVGNAELDGATAVFCATVKSIPTVLERRGRIAATTWSWAGVAAALPATVVVAAARRAAAEPIDLRARAQPGQLTIGVGSGYVAGRHVDVVIDAEGGNPAAIVPAGCAIRAPDASGCADANPGVEIVRAPVDGRFATAHRIGDRVDAGEIIGVLGQLPISAPRSGMLRGLSARGAGVRSGDLLVEVDPQADRDRCFGPQPHAYAVGHAVVAALAIRRNTAVTMTA